jgi:hypothetical protein
MKIHPITADEIATLSETISCVALDDDRALSRALDRFCRNRFGAVTVYDGALRRMLDELYRFGRGHSMQGDLGDDWTFCCPTRTRTDKQNEAYLAWFRCRLEAVAPANGGAS